MEIERLMSATVRSFVHIFRFHCANLNFLHVCDDRVDEILMKKEGVKRKKDLLKCFEVSHAWLHLSKME